jgi:predicted ATP-dependent endonuclease of OLD family
MKLKSLRISNVLSFKYEQDIQHSEVLNFEEELNIIIGENGSGKSTALEVINFIFKRVLYKQYDTNQDFYSRKLTIDPGERRRTISAKNAQTYSEFRLDPNWDTPDEAQVIRIELSLDSVDENNILLLQTNMANLNSTLGLYSERSSLSTTSHRSDYVFDITLNRRSNNFTLAVVNGDHDFGVDYLTEYNFYKELIELYNSENPATSIQPLYESYTLISSYRNYHAFEPSISLGNASASHQIQQIKSKDYSRSLNTSDQSEPSIFALVRLRIAEEHYKLIPTNLDKEQCEERANQLAFLQSINNKLAIINLKCVIRLIEQRTWDYAFEFIDISNSRVLRNINSLSAGQKAIIHLVFEAYGRGDLKGGVVIIDEPEIHLHYQFQNEYLQVIKDLNRTQGCQYVLVTHSEALITSTTINHVKRFSLNSLGHTQIKAPSILPDQRILIKILDNTRSTYAFFAKKVLLVEGDSDRYFYKAIIQEKYPNHDQQIAVLELNGKGNFANWSNLFQSFGLTVYRIADLDYSIDMFYPNYRSHSVKTPSEISTFKSIHSNWESNINGEYTNHIYILKEGALETYLGIPNKGLDLVINFCDTNLTNFLNNTADSKSIEINEIIRLITL